jgi:hypothetical protein
MQHLTRFIGTVIVMIAFLVASSAAQAHGGHDHAPSPESSASIAIDASIAVAAMGDTAAPSVQEISERAGILSHSGIGNRCLGGCCSSAHICCVASLPTIVDPVLPIAFGPSGACAEPVLGDGLDPEALRRPPRSFA